MSTINVIAELERLAYTYTPASDTEIKICCPFHADASPSCSISTSKLQFHCHAAGCGASGDIFTLFAKLGNSTRAVVFADMATRYDLEAVKAVNPTVIEDAHKEIWAHPLFLSELYKRGVTDELIRKYRLGVHKGRVSIPVKNDAGTYVNMRLYLPGAPGADKMRNLKGRGQIRPYPVEQLKYDSVVVCGGEVKAIVAASVLNAHGIGCICASGGEGNWHPSMTARLRNKRVYVLLDIDSHGVTAAEKLARTLVKSVNWLGIVHLPLDIDRYPHGDVNDFVATEKGDLWQLLQSASQWSLVEDSPSDNVLSVPFTEAVNSKNVGKKISFVGIVAATAEQPYIVPAEVSVTCDKNQEVCAACAVYPLDNMQCSIPIESASILQMCGVGKDKLDGAMRDALGVPRKCGVVLLKPVSHYDIEDIRVSPSLEISNTSTDRPMQHAVCVGSRPELNGTYEFTARMWPHPQTQHATLVVSKAIATQDALSAYTPGSLERLKIFQPTEWSLSSLTERLLRIYADFEANVTRIYHRTNLHVFSDLAYHSPLLIPLEGKVVKGWTEILIIGDSAQGKTEVADGLMRHYGLGEKVVCKNASLAGLMGGLKQLGTQWYVSWGVIPTHDRRLVILEELKGASVDVISRLTDMRSSGIAEIPKIEKRRTHARTRLLALSNPRNDRVMSSYSFGVDAVKELIGAPEDIRRFDAVLIVAAQDVDPKLLTATVKRPPVFEHTYTSDLCRELLLWAWTRKPSDIDFSQEAIEELYSGMDTLCASFTESVPIVDRGSIRQKLARLATALAVRTFSVDGDRLVVQKCHVQYIVKMLFDVYSSKTFGYRFYTEAYSTTRQLRDPGVIKTRISALPHPQEFTSSLLYADGFDIVDICDWTGYDRAQAQDLLSHLVRKQAIRRNGAKYYKTPEFIEFLKTVEFSARPTFETEEKF